jgi:hypothetical protein
LKLPFGFLIGYTLKQTLRVSELKKILEIMEFNPLVVRKGERHDGKRTLIIMTFIFRAKTRI